MLYSGFTDLIKIRESMAAVRAAVSEKRIRELQGRIEKEKADCEKETAEFMSKLRELAAIEKAGETARAI